MRENVEIVRRGFERFAGGEPQHPRDYAPDFEMDNSDGVMAGGIFRGVEGLEEFRAVVSADWEEMRFEAVEYLAAPDDRVVVAMRLVGLGRGGIETTAMSTLVFQLRDRRVVSGRSYQDHADALSAAGLS